MNRKEILIPRYKILINYPGMSEEIGTIINCEDIEEAQYYAQYPEIFEELSWWQNRLFEELPLYIGYFNHVINKQEYITNNDPNNFDGMFNWCSNTEPLWEEDIENYKQNPKMDNNIINKDLSQYKKEYLNAVAQYWAASKNWSESKKILGEKRENLDTLLIQSSNITTGQIKVLQKCCELTNNYLLDDPDLIKMKELNYITEYTEHYHIITQLGLDKLIELNSFYNRHDKEIEAKKLRRKISKL